MLKFDFNTYVKPFINETDYNNLLSRKEEILDKFNHSIMTGWTKEISSELVIDLKRTADYIKNNFDCLVVIGIGGSFLGSYAFDKMFAVIILIIIVSLLLMALVDLLKIVCMPWIKISKQKRQDPAES